MICIPIYLVIIIIIIIILWIYIFNDINQIKNRINKKSKDNIESSESTKNTESKIINTYPIYNDIIYNDIQKRSFLNIRDKKYYMIIFIHLNDEIIYNHTQIIILNKILIFQHKVIPIIIKY